jgi:glycosyltransferase involved in cell wall biosynthesis
LRIAIVSFGHVDVVLPLFKHLKASSADIDLYLCFSLNRKAESILNFYDKLVTTGFTDYIKTEELLGQEIANYLGDISKVRFFIFHNLKLRSFRNFHLSKKLTNNLKLYDIIHFNGTNSVLPILIYLLRKKKLIFTIHDIQSHSGEKTKFNFAERLNKFLIKSKYPVIVQNVADFEKLRNEFYAIKDKFRFIPFGELEVYREFEIKDQKTNDSDLLFFGRISPYKGIEYMISALEILKKRKIHIRTIIAGDGEIFFDTTKLEESSILLINRYIPNSELVNLIMNTKIVVCPYTDATQSGVVMTAYAFNKPVIASSVGSFPEVIEEGITGALVKPGNDYDLAEKIKTLLSNPDLLEKMSLNIHTFTYTGNYSWNRIIEKVNDLYVSALT